MLYSLKQNRLFQGVAHGSIKPRKGLTRAKAAKMAKEGIKRTASRPRG